MTKNSKKELDETMRVMGRLAAMPHKPHIAKKPQTKKLIKKGK